MFDTLSRHAVQYTHDCSFNGAQSVYVTALRLEVFVDASPLASGWRRTAHNYVDDQHSGRKRLGFRFRDDCILSRAVCKKETGTGAD